MLKTRKRKVVGAALAALLVASMALIPLASADNNNARPSPEAAQSFEYTETMLDGTLQEPGEATSDPGQGEEGAEQDGASGDLSSEQAPGSGAQPPSGGGSAPASDSDAPDDLAPETDTPSPADAGGGEEANGAASISGLVWHDENEDGVRTADEAVVPGFAVTLCDDSEQPIAETRTESDGTYSFSEVEPGAYRVKAEAQTIDGTEYLPPLPDADTERDNKFEADPENEESIAYTKLIEVEADAAITALGAGVRSVEDEALVGPLALDELIVDMGDNPINWANLETVLKSLFSEEDIASATTLKIVGGQNRFQLSGSSTTPSMTYLNGLNITTIDLSTFTGEFYAYALANAKNITTVALGTNVTAIPASAFAGCTSLTTVSDTLGNAAANPGIVDLASTGVTQFSGMQSFRGCSSITAVTVGPDVSSLNYDVFGACSSLTTFGGSVADVRAYPGVLDFSSTNLTALGQSAFSQCSSITTVALGKNIEVLPGNLFTDSKALSSVSDTPEHALANSKVIDLEKTGVTTLDAAGRQFANNEAFTTVTLGPDIKQLPGNVFAGCKTLRTLSDSLINATANPNVIDLEKTAVASLDESGWQFANCWNITTVALGTDITVLPPYVFTGCLSMHSLSDTALNAQASRGFIDFEKFSSMTFPSGGWQFNGASNAIVYVGADGMSFPNYSLGSDTAFVPETIDSVAFSATPKASKFYVRGPEATSPTSVENAEYQAINYYLETKITSSGEGAATVDTYNVYNPFVNDRINEREIAKGNLTSGWRYVEEGKELRFTVFPYFDSKLKEITYNGEVVEPLSIENETTYILPALTEDTEIHFEFTTEYNIIHVHQDRNGTPIAGYGDEWFRGDGGDSYDGEPTDIPGYVYQGFQLTSATSGTPSLVADKAEPHIDEIEGNTYLYLIYGRDAGGGESPGASGGGTQPDGVEDIDIVRHWGTVEDGAFTALPSTSPDTQIVNIGSAFALADTDAPVPSIPTGYSYVGYLTDQDAAGAVPHAGAPAITASVAEGSREVYYIYEQSSYTVTEHHVNRAGETVSADTSETLGHAERYDGSNVKILTGMVYVGADYAAPSEENRSTVEGGATPEIASVESNAEVWYVYGTDNGGATPPGPGGGGVDPDGFEDFSFTRQWVTRGVDGTLAPLPSTDQDVQILNVGTSFELGHDDAPAPAIPAGYEYQGYLTDRDAPGDALHAGDPAIESSIANGDRVVSYVYAAPLDGPGIEAPLETALTITGSADRGNSVTVTFANGQTATSSASSLTPLAATGYWSVDVPAGVILTRGDVVSATQTDAFGRTSPLATATVQPVDHTVTISYADDAGRTIPGGATSTVAHRNPFSYAPPAVTGYTYSGWALNGADQGSGNPSIPNVTGPHAITLVYKASGGSNPDPGPKPNPGPEEENYNFVKAPNVKSVKPGETITYTFTGFENKWGASLDRYAITDKPDQGLDFVSASLPAFSGAADVSYDVVYYTNHKGRTVLHSGIDANKPFSFNAPSLGAGEHITGLVIDFGTVPAGFGAGNEITMQFRVWDNPPSKTLNNVGMLSYWKDGEAFEFSSGKSGSVVLGGYFSDLVRTGDGPFIAVALAVVGGIAAAVIAIVSLVVRSRRKKRAAQ